MRDAPEGRGKRDGAEALVGGFTDPVIDAQGVFRTLLDAMARPGRVVEVAGCPPPPAGLHPASFALALTLFDGDTPLWLSPALRTEAVEISLRFHCGCRLVDDPLWAAFSVAAEADAVSLAAFCAGDERFPDRSASVALQVGSLEGGPPIELAGPGIAGAAEVAPAGLPEGFWAEWQANHARYPLGVDVILVAGARLVALPRSVAARMAET